MSNDGPILIVEESDDTESAWRLKTRRVTLSEAARHDGGGERPAFLDAANANKAD